MSLRWKNAVVSEDAPKSQSQGPSQNQKQSLGRVSKQRKYKVRFQSDIRSARKAKTRQDVEAPRPASPPRLHDTSITSPSVTQGEKMEVRDLGADLGADLEGGGKPASLPLGAVMQDATLLYSFSAEHYVPEQAELLPVMPENFETVGGAEDMNSAGAQLADLVKATPSGSSPQLLTFQTDILPNIQRQLPSVSWPGRPYSEKRVYLQYYIEKVVPRLMPLWNSADNPFLCIVIPASTESAILTHAIIALASYHLSVQPSGGRGVVPGPDIGTAAGSSDGHGVEALRHKQKVLMLLRENLTKPDVLRDEATLAACMLMQTFEVLFCGTSGWDHWLKGATHVLRLRGKLESDLKDSNSWIRLAKCVVAIETFAATSTRFDLLISEEYWNIFRRIREDYLHSVAMGEGGGDMGADRDYSEDKHFAKLVGCPVVVVYSLGRMVMLRQSREEMEAASSSAVYTSSGNELEWPGSNSNSINTTFSPSTAYSTSSNDPDWHSTWSIESIKLEHLLFRWRPHDVEPDRANLSEAFRHAALIYYYRKIRRLDYGHETVQHHVESTFRHLELFLPSSDVEGIALWPTMIAAIEIDEVRHANLMQLAIKFIQGMKRNIRDPLYRNAEKALNLMWSRRRHAATLEAKRAVDWDELSKEMDWKWCFV